MIMFNFFSHYNIIIIWLFSNFFFLIFLIVRIVRLYSKELYLKVKIRYIKSNELYLFLG